MKILFLAPLPPPVTGHSLVSQVLCRALQKEHEVRVTDLSKASKHDGTVTVSRVSAVLASVWAAFRQASRADVIYLTIAESLAGNLKDLAIYLVVGGKIRSTVVHLHGGSIRRLLFDKSKCIAMLNRHFLSKAAAVIVSGPSHARVFEGMVQDERLHFVPNFAEDHLFVERDLITRKFTRSGPLRVLFLSGMDPDKGSGMLIEAFCSLPPDVRTDIRVDVAGRFSDPAERLRFEEAITGVPNLHYHGVVADAEKQRLLSEAHVFCLPTALLEGQPISILEAYASGCAVITTTQPGILDIFTPGKNGWAVEARNPASIAAALTAARDNRQLAGTIAQRNHVQARENFRTVAFSQAVARILESAGSSVGT